MVCRWYLVRVQGCELIELLVRPCRLLPDTSGLGSLDVNPQAGSEAAFVAASAPAASQASGGGSIALRCGSLLMSAEVGVHTIAEAYVLVLESTRQREHAGGCG